MSILMVDEDVDFNSLKERLGVTDGNLASHTHALEKLEYLAVKKEFIGKKPRTTYTATKKGRSAFSKHLDALERLLDRKI